MLCLIHLEGLVGPSLPGSTATAFLYVCCEGEMKEKDRGEGYSKEEGKDKSQPYLLPLCPLRGNKQGSNIG